MTSLFTDGSRRALAATQPGVLTDRTFEWLFPLGFHCEVIQSQTVLRLTVSVNRG